jgi:hypothetical protein
MKFTLQLILKQLILTVWNAGWNELRPAFQTSIQSDKYQVSHWYGIFSYNGHIVARNMYRKSINILRKIVYKVGSIYKIIQGY